MKSLLLIRHAKSSWDSLTMKDFDRPLNERGHRDAPMMAKRLLDKGVEIDAFVSSTAVRALTTAKYFHEAYKAKKQQLIEVPDLYHAPPSVFFEVIANLDDEIKCAALFSHNPGITAMVNRLGAGQLDDMPTCAIFAVHAEIEKWKDFRIMPKKFWFFDYPKL